MTLRVSPDQIVAADTTGVLGIHPTWARVRLGEVATVQNGFAFKSSLFSKDAGVPLLRIRDVGSNDPDTFINGEVEPDYVVRRGDIVIGMDGDFRAARWEGPDAALNQRVCRVIPNSAEYDRRFLFHTLQPYLDAVNRATSAVTVKHLSSGTVADLPLPLPPLNEQERIVVAIEEAFSKLDAGEAGLRTVRQLLKRMREAILTAAVTGRLFPQDPTDTPAAKVLADLGVEAAEPEGVPALPPSWSWAELGVIAEVVGGVTKDSKRQSDPSFVEVPYLRVANVQRGFLDLETITTIRVAPEKAAQLELQPGDVLFNEGGDRDKLGRGWVWEGQIASCIHQNHVFRARLSGGVEPKLVSIWGNTFGRGWFEDRGKQTTNLASLNLKTLKAFPVPIAPVEEQSRILAEVERQMSFLDACERAVDVGLARAAGLRRSVLKAAFEGRLVPQDPSDEPAWVLLERIRAERALQPIAKRRARQTA